MSKNVAEELSGKATSLFEKLTSSYHIATLVMALVGKIVWEAANKGRPIEGVIIGPISAMGDEFRFKVTYSMLPVPSMGMWQFGNDLLHYVSGRSQHLALALSRNPKMIDGLSRLVNALDRYASHKGKKFSELKVKKSFVNKSDVFVIVMGQESLDA